jgi:hypothetical protein
MLHEEADNTSGMILYSAGLYVAAVQIYDLQCDLIAIWFIEISEF